jgi:hypothetical protein
VRDTHTATINWGDGATTNATVTETNGNGSVSGTHTYSAAGLFTVTMTLTDKDGGTSVSSYTYVTVNNPAAGYESGSGSFASPSGAWRNTTLTGTATISKLYARHAADGTMNYATNGFNMSYSTGSMNFASTKMYWLVLNGTTSWVKGEGNITISGVPYPAYFLVSVVDSTTVADKVRVKIWNKTTGELYYDNQKVSGVSAPDSATATLSVSTGPGTVMFLH